MNAVAARPMPTAPTRPASRSLPFPGGPDVTIPLRFLVAGLLCLFAGVGLLVARPQLLVDYHYHQHIVAVTHLFLLGFILSIVVGAMYQLVPVALETHLHSERLARWHFPVHVIGALGMVAMFWIWNMKQVGHFGSALAIGVGLFVWNLVRTLRQVRGWTVVSFGIASCLVWLVTVILAGLILSAAKSTYERVGQPGLHPLLALPLEGLKATADAMARFEPLGAMHAHAHLGILGVFILLIVAVAYKLVPMFLISEVQSPVRAWSSIALLNLGLVASFVAILLQSRFKPAAAALVVAGLVVYGIELAAIVRARKRRAIDWGLRTFLVSQSLLVPASVLGLVLSRPEATLTEFVGRLENAYGFIVILGVIAFAILGMLYKILPFLVWFAVYSGEVGRARTPALHEMISTRLQAAGFWLWLGGLLAGLAGILSGQPAVARLGALLLAASLVAFAVNAARILSHFFRPRIEPFAPSPRRQPLAS